jgi:hypothetical protein
VAVLAAVLAAVLGAISIVLASVIYIQALKMQDMRRKTDIQVQSAQKTTRVLVELLQNPAPQTPPDRLIESIGVALTKIVTGGEIKSTVEGQLEDDKTSEHYFPDVEFDEWLGNEGIPPTPGWWSPPKSIPNSGENNENAT